MPSLNDTLLTDLAFTDDLQVSSTGDLDVMSGLTNLREAILRRIVTVPGSLVHRPTYGCGLLQFQGAPMTLSLQRQIASRLAEQLPLDPRIEEVTGVSVTVPDDKPDMLVLAVRVTVAGLGEQTFQYTPFHELRV